MPNGGDLTFATDIATLDEAACRAHPSALTPGRYVEIRVTDTGTGMSPATLKHLFEPFFTTKAPGKGTGMGLASVYGTLTQHRGGISVSSEPGRGSTFRIHLPLPEADAAPAACGTGALAGAHSRGRLCHILVVEDEPLVRDLAAEAARALGHQVTLCRDGEEAVEVYSRTWPQIDLVVLDVVMPKKAGRETFQALRAINPAVRVLVFSGYALDGDAQALLDDGALDFLRKPFSLAEFSRKLSALLPPL
jgi:CheY-like chemotaxis protein